MKRYKRIFILLGALVVVSGLALAVSRHETRREQIEVSGQVVLELPVESVDSLAWEYEDRSLSFHRDDTWHYDDDEAFPVDEDKIGSLLEPFQAFAAAFTIQAPEDLGQYGLDSPLCTIRIGAGEDSCTIALGNYSTMDAQRYVSIGDGNVYLAVEDPLDAFDVELRDLILQDEVPDFGQVRELRFSGSLDYKVTWQTEGGDSYREEDVCFTDLNGTPLPLDTDKVEGYLRTLRNLELTDYVTYTASDEVLEACGLDDPELTILVTYTPEDGEEGESSTFTLSVSRDPEERAAAEAAAAEGTDAVEEDDTAEEELTAYARVGESSILYQISASDYRSLMAASRDDLRHAEILPAHFADITRLNITLDGVGYTITTQGGGDERTYYYQDQELDIGDLRDALEDLEAETFTEAQPAQREEIRLTAHLDLEGEPSVTLIFYRYDGSSCLAVVDGSPLALVPRSQVVALVESVNAIVLN